MNKENLTEAMDGPFRESVVTLGLLSVVVMLFMAVYSSTRLQAMAERNRQSIEAVRYRLEKDDLSDV